MTEHNTLLKTFSGHRTILLVVLCLFGLCVAYPGLAPKKKKPRAKDTRIYLVHSDELKYDMYGPVPDAQIVKGNVHFLHEGAHLWCDSAYFYQASNSVKAFGHVRLKQGDTLTLTCEWAAYDGASQKMQARKNVVLKHRRQTLYTDSLDYDRLYDYAYFFEGGRLVDGQDKLVSDWGEYHTDSREARFFYNVKLTGKDRVITTDTLHYDTRTSVAHVLGPSVVKSKTGVINTSDGFFNTKSDQATLYGRSTVVDKKKELTADSLFHNDKTGQNRAFGKVVYVDKANKQMLNCEKLIYNEKTGTGFAIQDVLAKDYSQKDTLYAHADTMRIYTFNINTDSVYRKVHCYPRVRAYRIDIQAVCDSLVFHSKDSCATLYKGPVAWSGNRQISGTEMQVFFRDSTVRFAHVIGNALSVEQTNDNKYFNQLASKEQMAYFVEGKVRRNVAVGNVQSVFFPVDEKDSSLVMMNYLETDTMRMFISPERKLEKIWTNKGTGTCYPMSQIPPGKSELPNFMWLDEIRPKSPADVMVWKDNKERTRQPVQPKREPPLQNIRELRKDNPQ